MLRKVGRQGISHEKSSAVKGLERLGAANDPAGKASAGRQLKIWADFDIADWETVTQFGKNSIGYLRSPCHRSFHGKRDHHMMSPSADSITILCTPRACCTQQTCNVRTLIAIVSA